MVVEEDFVDKEDFHRRQSHTFRKKWDKWTHNCAGIDRSKTITHE
jgi:hypothetical protein